MVRLRRPDFQTGVLLIGWRTFLPVADTTGYHNVAPTEFNQENTNFTLQAN